MIFINVKLDDKTHSYIEVARLIFLKYHPEYVKRHLSKNFMIMKAFEYYISNENDFKYVLEKKNEK
jgi:hypothetical protein